MKKVLFVFIISLSFVGCADKANSQESLKPIDTFDLLIKEPSGITFFDNHLYIVSDKNGALYKTNLKGEIIKKIKTDFNDLEGITVNPKKPSLLIVSESKRQLIEVDFKGKLIKKFKIDGKQHDVNHGLEGVCYDSEKGLIYLVNEKSPKKLLVVSKKGNIKDAIKLDFTNDISGICFDAKSGNLWIVSDESQKIVELTSKGKLLHSYHIPVHKPEGITIVKNNIYIVSDSKNKLFVFKKP